MPEVSHLVLPRANPLWEPPKAQNVLLKVCACQYAPPIMFHNLVWFFSLNRIHAQLLPSAEMKQQATIPEPAAEPAPLHERAHAAWQAPEPLPGLPGPASYQWPFLALSSPGSMPASLHQSISACWCRVYHSARSCQGSSLAADA